RTFGNLEINLGAESRTERTIDIAGYRRGQMAMSISAAGNHDDRQPRIHNGRIRSEETQPGALTNAGAGLTRNCLLRPIGFLSGTVIDRPNHARDHAFPNLIIDVDGTPHFSFEVCILVNSPGQML